MTTIVTQDVDLQRAVRAALACDPAVEAIPIGIEVSAGIVRLIGSVARAAEKEAAERAAFRVTGVCAVANELTITLPGIDRPDDTEVAEQITSAFGAWT